MRHLVYAPHCERRAAVRGADNGQNMCHGVEVGCQHCSASVSTRNKKDFISQFVRSLSASAAVLVSGGETESLLHFFPSPSHMP